MKLQELTERLETIDTVRFQLPNGSMVKSHFHITELMSVTKKSIDCGGKLHEEQTVMIQLWEAMDIHHRLKPKKLLGILNSSIETLNLGNDEIEIEYQTNGTIAKYGLEFNGKHFMLTATKTECKALDSCNNSAGKIVEKAKD